MAVEAPGGQRAGQARRQCGPPCPQANGSAGRAAGQRAPAAPRGGGCRDNRMPSSAGRPWRPRPLAHPGKRRGTSGRAAELRLLPPRSAGRLPVLAGLPPPPARAPPPPRPPLPPAPPGSGLRGPGAPSPREWDELPRPRRTCGTCGTCGGGSASRAPPSRGAQQLRPQVRRGRASVSGGLAPACPPVSGVPLSFAGEMLWGRLKLESRSISPAPLYTVHSVFTTLPVS